MSAMSSLRLDIQSQTKGRAVLARSDGTIYISRNYAIHRSSDGGRSWIPVTRIPCSAARRLAERSRLASRLLRQEVKALLALADGTHVASTREWVYYAAAGEPVMRRSRVDEGSQPLSPPMCMTAGPRDRVLWGEYDSHTAHGKPVRLYVSDDGGRSYSVARVFEGGSILHVHNLKYDAPRGGYWLLAGDHHHEPGIGWLTEDLRDFRWIAKGEQRYRAVDVFDLGDRLVYATDSEREQNCLMTFDKATGRFVRGREFEGSCIYSCRFGPWYAVTTSVEPSAVNRSRDAALWLSRDAEVWHEVFRSRKDSWHPVFFQFGSIVLPRGESNQPTVVFSGQALRGIDNRVMVAAVREVGAG